MAGSLAKLGLPLAVGLNAAADSEQARNPTCIRVRASLPGLQGTAWLFAPATTIEGWLNILGPSAGVAMELAETRVTRSEASGASVGDLVVFDETEACSPASSWPLRLRWGGRHLLVVLDPQGDLRTPSSTISGQAWAAGMPRDTAQAEEQVVLTAEIGHFAEGSQETSASPRGDGILLYMDKKAWAEGTMAAYDGRFAVRITQVVADG